MQKTTEYVRNLKIKLSNENTWQLTSTPETSEWLDRLCTIMELSESEGESNHNIIFLKSISNEYNFIKAANLGEIYTLNTGPLRISSCQNSSHIICEIGDMPTPELELLKMAQSVFPIYMGVLNQGGLPLHAALLERKGVGIAIAAPGGTGKSTCARRIPLPWQALGDDEMLIVRDRKDIYQAHPFPTWSRCNQQKPGETWNVQAHVPISAIFFLKKSQKDAVSPLSFSQAAALVYKLSSPVFYRIFGSIEQSACLTIKKLIFQNACNIARDIPAFILEASLTGKFWEAIDRAFLTDSKGGCANAKALSNAQ